MASPQVDGAYPRRVGTQVSSSTGSQAPRMDADARARAEQLAAQFTAQVELSMMQSLAQLGAAGSEEPGGGGDDAGGEDPFGMGGGLQGIGGGLDQLELMSTLSSGLRAQGKTAAQVQAQLAALGLGSGGAGGVGGAGALTSAGAGAEASLAQSLMAVLAGAGATGPARAAAPASASADARTNARIVADVARERGVDPVVAVAMMLVESGGRATAVGDGGTSFGLFQLHEGGMLTAAGLTPDQAFDARTNASVALKSYAHEWSKGHARRTPGQIAAASQRPADPVGYAAKVDATMDRARSLLG